MTLRCINEDRDVKIMQIWTRKYDIETQADTLYSLSLSRYLSPVLAWQQFKEKIKLREHQTRCWYTVESCVVTALYIPLICYRTKRKTKKKKTLKSNLRWFFQISWKMPVWFGEVNFFFSIRKVYDILCLTEEFHNLIQFQTCWNYSLERK